MQVSGVIDGHGWVNLQWEWKQSERFSLKKKIKMRELEVSNISQVFKGQIWGERIGLKRRTTLWWSSNEFFVRWLFSLCFFFFFPGKINTYYKNLENTKDISLLWSPWLKERGLKHGALKLTKTWKGNLRRLVWWRREHIRARDKYGWLTVLILRGLMYSKVFWS